MLYILYPQIFTQDFFSIFLHFLCHVIYSHNFNYYLYSDISQVYICPCNLSIEFHTQINKHLIGIFMEILPYHLTLIISTNKPVWVTNIFFYSL